MSQRSDRTNNDSSAIRNCHKSCSLLRALLITFKQLHHRQPYITAHIHPVDIFVLRRKGVVEQSQQFGHVDQLIAYVQDHTVNLSVNLPLIRTLRTRAQLSRLQTYSPQAFNVRLPHTIPHRRCQTVHSLDIAVDYTTTTTTVWTAEQTAKLQ